MRRVIVIVGPTSSGKSAYAVALAMNIGGEIISADSRQVYRGLDIGTGKVTKKETRRVPHHLLDVASPKEVFTAHDFVQLGRKAIDGILARSKTPIICGGSGFYIEALLGRVALPDVPANTKLRARLVKKSVTQLYSQLQHIDPRRAKHIDKHNPVRLIRAIEIAKALGRVPKNTDLRSPYSIEWIGLKPDDAILRKNIHTRLLGRMKSGMVAEARELHAAGLSYKRMESLGLEYRWLARFLQKKVTGKEMLVELERDIWRYARRQMTYWRRNKDIQWI